VSRWQDLSGNGQDAVQTDPDRQPALEQTAPNALPMLRFGGDDFLITPLKRDWSGTDWTLFVVASLDADTPANYRGIIGNRFGDGRENWWSLGTRGDGMTYLELAAGVGVDTTVSPANARACAYTVVKQGPHFSLYRNGALMGEKENANVGGLSNELRIGLWLGADQGWKGTVAEVILCEGALDTPGRDHVESSLSDKWDIFFAQRVLVKKATWPETMLASRTALRDWTSKPGMNQPGNEAAAELWEAIQATFPEESGRFTRLAAAAQRSPVEWFQHDADCNLEKALIAARGTRHAEQLEALSTSNMPSGDPRWLALVDEAGKTRDAFIASQQQLDRINIDALRRAIGDLSANYPDRYTKGQEFASRLIEIEGHLPEIKAGLAKCDDAAMAAAEGALKFQQEALLANPLLDFDKLLFIRRSTTSPALGLVQNWQSNCALPASGFDDAIAQLSPVTPDGQVTPVYKPEKPVFVGDVDLNFDADRMLFSSIGTGDRWQIFEVGADGTGLRQVTRGDDPDVDNYDPCWLPDGRVMFCSTAYFTAVPCVNGSTRCANLFRMDADGANMHQLCFDQEHNWCPTVLPSGRVLYLRWEYTDTPHTHDRVLFHMNPDGTGQMEYYGSNSYWPNSLFYARPIPESPNKFIGIVSGHHGVPRMGELVLFDVTRGRREAEGAVQRIPGYGKTIEWGAEPGKDSPLIADNLVDASWPKFLHPYPLNEKYFLVSCKPTPDALWGLYLVDVFDNMLLLREEPGYALFEPVPLRKTPRPPVVPDVTKPDRDDALVYLSDVYAGGGLRGIPRGEVKSLRLFTYHFLYPGMGGPQAVVGMEGPWDMRRTLGTVPVEEDGSAYFRVPANTPISVQPLDSEGKALQLMRSWFTGMRGEVLSCVGCHESQNSAPPQRQTTAFRREPSEIKPWRGPARGYNFDREVQPVLDKYCIGCHDGNPSLPNFKERTHITDYSSVFHSGGVDAGHFSVSYTNLHRFVRRPGLESDYHLLTPMEFHADSTELVQKLRKGHHNVTLDAEAWDRVITWIDFNAPFHGTWTELAGKERVDPPATRRREMLKKYAGMDTNPEAVVDVHAEPSDGPIIPDSLLSEQRHIQCAGWPFTAEEAKRRREADGPFEKTVDLGNGHALQLVRIPAGDFIMGDAAGLADESPANAVHIAKPFWMGTCEITNAQFACFDPKHDSAVESRFSMQFGVRGFYVNGPDQPVVRVSWNEAMAFCEWLGTQTGQRFTLPTEAQWEYACRAGTSTPFFYGNISADWSSYANLADAKLSEFVCHTYKKEREPWPAASKYDDWIPKDKRFNDGGFLSDGTGLYKPNPWGLHDMTGNVSEWTRSDYKPYPYSDNDGRNDTAPGKTKVARGGSWRDRPAQARSAYRLPYRAYQPVYNVGFRIISEE
jgi:formylglycine-generating enzyme required for sulfatase activity